MQLQISVNFCKKHIFQAASSKKNEKNIDEKFDLQTTNEEKDRGYSRKKLSENVIPPRAAADCKTSQNDNIDVPFSNTLHETVFSNENMKGVSPLTNEVSQKVVDVKVDLTTLDHSKEKNDDKIVIATPIEVEIKLFFLHLRISIFIYISE